MLWCMARTEAIENWIERGLVLGALGGLCGFFLSGLVHYNWGDSEVVTIFYFIMGLSLSLRTQVSGLKSQGSQVSRTRSKPENLRPETRDLSLETPLVVRQYLVPLETHLRQTIASLGDHLL